MPRVMEIDQSAVKGEPGTGYEGPDKGPFACHNCEYFRMTNSSCGQELMVARSMQPPAGNGRVKVDSHGCCEYVERVGGRKGNDTYRNFKQAHDERAERVNQSSKE